MSPIDTYIIFAYLILIFAIGIWAGRNLKSIKEFAVAGRSYSAFVLFATLSASFIGGGFSFGNAAKVYEYGLGYSTSLWGFSLMLILIGFFIAPKIGARFSNCISAGDMMRLSYGKSGQIAAGVLGLCVCTGILAAQVGAMGAVFKIFLGIPIEYGAYIGLTIVILYTSFGGMKAVVLTDVVQFIILIICIPLTVIFAFIYLGEHNPASLDLIAQIPFFTKELTPIMWLSLFLSFLLGETLVPPYTQRLLIAKSAQTTKTGTLLSGFLSIPFFIITGSVGLLAFTIAPSLEANLAMPYLISTVLPIGLKGFACAGIISIIMSSADSFLNSASVCLIRDIVAPLKGKPFEIIEGKKSGLVLIQLITLAIGFASVLLALQIGNVLDILLFSYRFWSPVILCPLVAVLLGISAPKICFWLGGGVGAVIVIYGAIFCDHFLYGIDSGVIGTFANTLVFFITYQITKRHKAL